MINLIKHRCRRTKDGHTYGTVDIAVASDTSGQSYKASMIVIYDSSVIPDLKIPHITTLES